MSPICTLSPHFRGENLKKQYKNLSGHQLCKASLHFKKKKKTATQLAKFKGTPNLMHQPWRCSGAAFPEPGRQVILEDVNGWNLPAMGHHPIEKTLLFYILSLN